MKRYYLKLSGTAVLQRIMYDNAAAPSSGGYTEVTQAVYEGVVDPDKDYTYSGGTLSDSAKTLSNAEQRRRAAPDIYDAIDAVSLAAIALDAGDPIPTDADDVVTGIKDTYDTYPP